MSIVLRNAVLMVVGAVSLGLAGGTFVKLEMRPVVAEQRYARYESLLEIEVAQATYPEDLTAPVVRDVRFDLEGEVVPSEAAPEEAEAVPAEATDTDGFTAVDEADDGELLAIS